VIYNMQQVTRIAGVRLDSILRAELRASRNEPGAKLTLTIHNSEQKKNGFKAMDEITWAAGYAETGLKDEFFGYVKEVTQGEHTTIIEARDPMWLCSQHRVKLQTSLSIKKKWDDFLGYLIPSGYGLSWDIKPSAIPVFTIRNVYQKTGTFVLWATKTARNLDLRWDNEVLVIQKAFDPTVLSGELPEFKFGYNIIEDKLSLKAGKKIQVQVRGEDQSYLEKSGSGSFGKYLEGVWPAKCEGCAVQVVEVDSLSSSDDAKDQAKTIWTEKNGWGFTGSFVALGHPSVKPSTAIQIRDPENAARTIKTYVDTVEKIYDFQEAKYRQEIFPSAFMEEPVA